MKPSPEALALMREKPPYRDPERLKSPLLVFSLAAAMWLVAIAFVLARIIHWR